MRWPAACSTARTTTCGSPGTSGRHLTTTDLNATYGTGPGYLPPPDQTTNDSRLPDQLLSWYIAVAAPPDAGDLIPHPNGRVVAPGLPGRPSSGTVSQDSGRVIRRHPCDACGEGQGKTKERRRNQHVCTNVDMVRVTGGIAEVGRQR